MRQRVRLRQPFSDHLACREDVGSGLEDHHDRGQAGDRLRVDLVEERHALQEVGLEGHRDQLLDLVRGQAEGLGVDLNVRRGEFREHIAGHAREPEEADQQRDGRQAQHEAPIAEAPSNDRTHHAAALPAHSGHRRPNAAGRIACSCQPDTAASGAETQPDTPDSMTSLSPIATRHSTRHGPPSLSRRGKANPLAASESRVFRPLRRIDSANRPRRQCVPDYPKFLSAKP